MTFRVSPYKDSNIRYFCKYCDHNHSPEEYDHDRNYIKTQKYDIFVKTVIIVAVLIKYTIYEDCDYNRNA